MHAQETWTGLSNGDEQWIRDVFEIIPRSVFYGGASTHEQPESAKKANAKKARANDHGDDEAKDVQKLKKKQSKSRKRSRAKLGVPAVDGSEPHRQMLQKKLADKLDELRAQRNAPPREEKKRGHNRGVENSEARTNDEGPKAKKVRIDTGNVAGSGIETNLVTGFINDQVKEPGEEGRRKGMSKLKLLERKLETATKERDMKKEASENKDAKGHAAVQQLEMDKALARVKGEKVKDDVTRLKKTIRKEKRKSVKSREEWAKRVKTQNREMKARQDKREKNLKERRLARTNKAAGVKRPKSNKSKGKGAKK